MQDGIRAFTRGYGWRPEPLKPFSVIERTRDNEGQGRRTDTVTSSLRYAIERRDDLRAQRRPAFVIDRDGRRVEVARWY